jgi:hypothetical protein
VEVIHGGFSSQMALLNCVSMCTKGMNIPAFGVALEFDNSTRLKQTSTAADNPILVSSPGKQFPHLTVYI